MQRVLSLLHQQSLTTALRSVSPPVDRSHIDTGAFRRLCADLKATMRREGGVGLAAPQCGERLKVFVMRAHPTHRRAMRSELSTVEHTPQRALISLADEAPVRESEWDERLQEEEEAYWEAREQECSAEEEAKRQAADERGHRSTPLVLINPVITAVSPQTGMRRESCLSIPGLVLHWTPQRLRAARFSQ